MNLFYRNLLAFLFFHSLSLSGNEKIDPAIDLNKSDYIPVFVRMNDQLIRGAGEYERLSLLYSVNSRSENHQQVLFKLQKKARDSWEEVSGKVNSLARQGKLRNLQKFWIVNGFSCLAKNSAIKELVGHSKISFIYLDRFSRPFRRSSALKPKEFLAMKAVDKVWEKKDFNRTQDLKIPWNVRAIGAQATWKEENATGRGVKVAVIDTGIVSTPSLIHALAKNAGEELNGIDDDGNGLIDDLFGYNFIENTGNILDLGATTSHGSSCAGIIAGRPSSSGLQTAIAPDSKIMLLKGGFDLRSLEYLMTNGSDIVSMSFMIVNRDLGHIRGLFRNAFEHLSLGGVLAVGGAGNFGAGSRRAMPAGKQIGLPKDIPCVLSIAGVDQSRNQVSFSSSGPCHWEGVKFFSDYPFGKPLQKPDLTAFPMGYPVWNISGSHRIRPNWTEVEKDHVASLVLGPAGNSFSGPHAAGVAALILSVCPDLNPWEISELLCETASELGPRGPDFKFGFGLINALAAVRAAKKRN